MPPNKTPQYGSPLLAILRGGKQTQAPKPVQFGVPDNRFTPPTGLPQTAQSTSPSQVNFAPVRQAPQMTPMPAPAVNPMDIIRRGKEQAISQGVDLQYRTPAPAGVFSGTGRAEMPAQNERLLQTMSRAIREKGLLPATGDLLFGEFGKRIAPNPNQYTDMWVERRDKLLSDGVVTSKEEAEKLAAQDIFNKTVARSGFTMTGEVPVPQVDMNAELTPEQRRSLQMINLRETAFAALDAPIFAGTTAVPKTALKQYARKVAADMTPADRELVNSLAEGNWLNPLEKKQVLADFKLTKASESEVNDFFTAVRDEIDLRWGGIDEVGVATSRPGAMDIKPVSAKAPDPKNFKTAEEYVKAQGTPVYHGTGETFDKFELQNSKNLGPNAIFFTPNKDSAEYYARGTKPQVKEAFVDASNFFDYEKPNDISKLWESLSKKTKDEIMGFETTDYITMSKLKSDLIKGDYSLIEKEIVQKAIKDLGFDGFYIKDYTGPKVMATFDPSKIKTRTQLIDEWKSAQPKTPTVPTRDYPGLKSQGGFADFFAPIRAKETAPKVVNSGDAVAFNRAADGLLGDSWTKLREVVQDNWLRAKNLQRTPGVKVEKGADPYLAETLFHGRVHTRLQEVKDNVIKIDKDIVTTAKKLNTNSDELTQTVNKYLQATHAPERNARLGDGAAGITTKEADDFIASVNASSLGKEVKRVTDELLELNRRTLTTLKEAQVIDDETFKTLTETYKNHVPLNRILDTTEDITQALSGRGFSVRGSGIKRATGSDREVADIITNITTNVEQAIIRAEKNLVDLQTLKFARNNKDLGLFEEIKPKAVGLDFEGKPIMQQITDPQVLAMRENGKPVYLKINDPHMAAMYQNVNLEHIPNMMQWIATFTRLYSSLHTRFNYEFAFSNKLRDIQEMAVDMASRKEMGFKQAGRAMTREPESIKAVTDFIRGADTEGARLYKQMQMDGGTTGGLSLSTRKQVEVDIEKIRQLNRSQPRRAARMLLEAVDNWNTIFEDSTRLSVYKQALSNGLDRETAAMLAKESTVNFNKKGTGGSVINGLYMFSNASIQGTTKMLRAMKNPKVAGAVVGGMGLAVYNLNKFNDSVDPDWRSKVTEFDRTSNMVIFLPSESSEAKYITIPVSWGLKPIKVAMEHTNDLMTGHNDDVPDAVRGIMIAVATSYNPLAGSESVVETLTPTFLKTPQEITSNTAWHGGKIRPDYDPNMPKSAQFFGSLENKATGRLAISATEKLADATGGEIQISPANINYAFEAYIGGLGRSVTKILNTITSIGKGEDLKPSEMPVASRFFKVRDTEQTETSRIYDELDKERKDRSEGVYNADRTFRELKQLSPEEQRAQMTEIAKTDPKLFDQLKTRYKKDAWTAPEKALASLTNANKARYLLQRLPEMSAEDRQVYVKDLLDKGVISKNVVEEMREQATQNSGIIEQ